ncbi:MAG: UDP-N-acetylglucosamine 2-epimerase (non-hydrolyzing) [Candidatus Glassbacteria bacterium]|nr:UDP-N-acetylglucosamine 2-epimerase (non-hydrolyzing) [Candidatus Glassbacteria bacterium]
MKSAFILGTRPEIIKLSPLIRAMLKAGSPFEIIHTNQHYLPELDKVFFEQLELPPPDYNLGVGHGSHGVQLGRMLQGLDPVLSSQRPDVVFVQGDTNSVLAGALMAHRLSIPVAHVEAGLRSYDRRMPEETNRILADRLSDYLLAPTEKAAGILLAEGFDRERIHVTGNTVVDALQQAAGLTGKLPPVRERWRVDPGNYILVTLHRPENVDSPGTLAGLADGLGRVGRELGMPLVFPVHPRTALRLEESGIALPESVIRLGPLDFLAFVQLEQNSRLVITDSGGVQEEACILGVPCVTARISTERPETVEVGANMVAGTGAGEILAAALEMVRRPTGWGNPFGDGQAGRRIIEIVAA